MKRKLKEILYSAGLSLLALGSLYGVCESVNLNNRPTYYKRRINSQEINALQRREGKNLLSELYK